jgi:endogenous inhibitor of DNA gyrase (YacG/DUF329 family)
MSEVFFCGDCPWCGKYVDPGFMKNNMPVIDFPMDLKVAQIYDKTDTNVITGDPFCPHCQKNLYEEKEIKYYPIEKFIDGNETFYTRREWNELREYIKNNPQIREEHKKVHMERCK